MLKIPPKMNSSLGLLSLGVALSVAPAIAQEAAKSQPVDFKKANPILKSIAKEMSKADEHIKNANPSFDEDYSDLEKKRLRYSVEAEMVNLPWGQKAEKGNFKGTTTYRLIETDQKDENGRQRPDIITVDSEITVKTDVLALARHSATVALKGNHYRNGDKKVETKTKELLERLARVESLDQLQELLQEGQNHTQIVLDVAIDEAPAEETRMSDVTKATWSSQKVAYSKIKIIPKKDFKNKLKMITVTAPSIGLLASQNRVFRNQVTTFGTVVEFARRSFRFVTQTTIILDYAQAGDRLKAELRKALNNLNSDKATSKAEGKAAVKNAYREALKSFKSVAVDSEFAQ